MGKLERHSIRQGGCTRGYPWYNVGVYVPHLTRDGRWIWRLDRCYGGKMYGYKRYLKAHQEVGEGSLQNVPLTAEEMVAHDAAHDGINLGVVVVA